MKLCAKRFILPLEFLALAAVLYGAGRLVGGEAQAIMASLVMYTLIPLTVISLLWAAGRTVGTLYRVYVAGEEWPRQRFSALEQWKRKNRAIGSEWPDLSALERAVYLILRAGGCLLVLAGIVLVFLRRGGPGLAVMLAGLLLRRLAAPETYNTLAARTRSVPCGENASPTRLYRAFRGVLTELGTPYLARVRFVKGNCLVFGPGVDGRFLYIRRGKLGRRLYIALAMSQYLLMEEKTPRLRGPEGYGSQWPRVGYDGLLTAITEMTRRYLTTGEVRLELSAPDTPETPETSGDAGQSG